MTSAHLLIVLLVGAAIGVLTGLVVGHSIPITYLAIIAGLLAAIISAMARNLIVARGAGQGPDDMRTPWVVVIFALVASLATDFAALEVARLSGLKAPVWVGALAGLFASIALGILMITYHTKPGEAPTLRRSRRARR